MSHTLEAFQNRQEWWCKATGLQKSNALSTSVLRWMSDWRYPDGFDHTGIYYWPRKRLHIMITEPYHSTEKALHGLQAMAKERNGTYSFSIGRESTGLWSPGNCVSLLVACDSAGEALEAMGMLLPAAGDQTKP